MAGQFFRKDLRDTFHNHKEGTRKQRTKGQVWLLKWIPITVIDGNGLRLNCASSQLLPWWVKWPFHASENAGCPQQMQAEGTYRDLLVPLNNRTVYRRNKHCLLWIKKTVKWKTCQVRNYTVSCVLFCFFAELANHWYFYDKKKLMSELSLSVSWFNL